MSILNRIHTTLHNIEVFTRIRVKTPAPEPPEAQIARLAKFIQEEIPGEPSQNQGAVDTAIRWMGDRVVSDLVKRAEELNKSLAHGVCLSGHCSIKKQQELAKPSSESPTLPSQQFLKALGVDAPVSTKPSIDIPAESKAVPVPDTSGHVFEVEYLFPPPPKPPQGDPAFAAGIDQIVPKV